MRDSAFQNLLDQTAKAAARHTELSERITAAFMERYGTTHSEVDADGIIDCLEYGNGEISVEECDREMAERGFPPYDWETTEQ